MIRPHDFNTAWWGKPVGIVTDPAFFDLSAPDRASMLAPYAWAEFKSPLRESPPARRVANAGFFWIDTQIEFRIGLTQIVSTPSLDALEVKFADESPFDVKAADLKPFEHERYLALPGATLEKINKRYAVWSTQLIADSPHWSLQLLNADGKTQGWFLSAPAPGGLNLSLAMLHREATVTGLHLYQKAIIAYAQRGARIGFAGFSVRNGPVHNVYAKLGAHFTHSIGCWLWLNGNHFSSEK